MFGYIKNLKNVLQHEKFYRIFNYVFKQIKLHGLKRQNKTKKI
jgi:hypothetical protein